MYKVSKYENLKDKFPLLNNGLCEFIQNDSLEIKRIKCSHESLESLTKKYPQIKHAYGVIFSPHVDKKYREYETFIFIDEQGQTLANVSGRELQLYGMLEKISDLRINNVYYINKDNVSASFYNNVS